MFKWRPEKEQAAIRVEKNYGGVRYDDEYIIKSHREIHQIIAHIKKNPEVYGRDMARKDTLAKPSTVTIYPERNSFVPNEPNIPVFAIVRHTYTDPVYHKSHTGLLVFILLLAAIIAFCAVTAYNTAKADRAYMMCKIYYKDGQPQRVEYGSTTVKISNRTAEDNLFMNPWVLQKLGRMKLSDCIKVYTE